MGRTPARSVIEQGETQALKKGPTGPFLVCRVARLPVRISMRGLSTACGGERKNCSRLACISKREGLDVPPHYCQRLFSNSPRPRPGP